MKCKACNNEITLDRGIRGSHGTDINGDLIPFWTVDPLKTPLGLAGQDYIGRDPMRRVYLKELQDYYNSIEQEMGLIKTDFLDVTKLNEPARRVHIEQLRVCIEKILGEKGMTLQDYFCNDRLGNLLPGKTQSEWTDVNRSIDGLPRILKNKPLRAIYIEELRRGIMIFGILCSRVRHAHSDFKNGQGYFHYDVASDKAVKNFNELSVLDSSLLSLEQYANHYSELGYLYLLYPRYIGSPDYTYRLAYARYNMTTHIWNLEFFEFADLKISGLNYTQICGCINEKQVGINECDINYFLYTTELAYSRIGAVASEVPDYYRLSEELGDLPYYLARYTGIKSRLLGISNGNVSQTVCMHGDINFSLIQSHVTTEDFFILVNNIVWSKVSDFSGSSATDKHYTLSGSGDVTFGDGVNGAIPLDTHKIVVRLSLYLTNYNEFNFDKTFPTNVISRDKNYGYIYVRTRKGASDKVYTPKIKYPTYIQIPKVSTHSYLKNFGSWNYGNGVPDWICRANTIVEVEGSVISEHYGNANKTDLDISYYMNSDVFWDFGIDLGGGHSGGGNEKIPDWVIDNIKISANPNSFKFRTAVAEIVNSGVEKWYYAKISNYYWKLNLINPRTVRDGRISFIDRYCYTYPSSMGALLATEWRIHACNNGRFGYPKILPKWFNYGSRSWINTKAWITHINGNSLPGGWFNLEGSGAREWWTSFVPGNYEKHYLDSFIGINYYIRKARGAGQNGYFPENTISMLPIIFTIHIKLSDDKEVDWWNKIYGFTPTKEFDIYLQAEE